MGGVTCYLLHMKILKRLILDAVRMCEKETDTAIQPIQYVGTSFCGECYRSFHFRVFNWPTLFVLFVRAFDVEKKMVCVRFFIMFFHFVFFLSARNIFFFASNFHRTSYLFIQFITSMIRIIYTIEKKTKFQFLFSICGQSFILCRMRNVFCSRNRKCQNYKRKRIGEC